MAIDCGAYRFPDNDMLDAMIASALKRLLDKHVHFRNRIKIKNSVFKNTTDSFEGGILLT